VGESPAPAEPGDVDDFFTYAVYSLPCAALSSPNDAPSAT
jgi:hypothetical protein